MKISMLTFIVIPLLIVAETQAKDQDEYSVTLDYVANNGIQIPLSSGGTANQQNKKLENSELKIEINLLKKQIMSIESEKRMIESELLVVQAKLASVQYKLTSESTRFRVPQTGQTKCWDPAQKDPAEPHLLIECASTGQDGDTQTGLAPPTKRFMDNNDGTITDLFTKLVWLKKADCLANNPPDWDKSISIAKQLNGKAVFTICGLEDDSLQGEWRVPNVNELMSLVEYGVDTSSGAGLPDSHPFSGFDGYYWTSTSFGLNLGRSLSDFLYPCRRQGYTDNRYRYNDAYVVDIATGEIVRLPKQLGANIEKRHKTSGSSSSCVGKGFTSGSPSASPYYYPSPSFTAVRNARAKDLIKEKLNVSDRIKS